MKKFIEWVEIPTTDFHRALESYMCSCGFFVEDIDSFRSEEYLVFDAAPHNVLVGIDGRLYFIDTQIKRLTSN